MQESFYVILVQCDGREKTQVNNPHLGLDLSCDRDFGL